MLRACLGVGLRILKGLVEIRIEKEVRIGYGKLASFEGREDRDREPTTKAAVQGDRVPRRGHAITARRAASEAEGVDQASLRRHTGEKPEGFSEIKGSLRVSCAEQVGLCRAGEKMEILQRSLRKDAGLYYVE